MFRPPSLNLKHEPGALSGRALLEQARVALAEVYGGLDSRAAGERVAVLAAGLRPESYEVPEEPREAKTFWINIYNALVIHGLLDLGPGVAVRSRPGFFRNTRYRIAGLDVSLDDIEHGFIRANRGHPIRLGLPQLGPWNPRRRWVLKVLDPRIHFALNCGAASCPPIRSYDPETIDQQLDLATAVFLSENVRVDHQARRLDLSRIFLWYRGDFGASWPARIDWIALHHPDEALAATLKGARSWPRRYLAYDWGPARPPNVAPR